MENNNTFNVEERVFVLGEVDQESVNVLIKKIKEINIRDDILQYTYEKKNEIYHRMPIALIINSYGGDVYAGLGLINAIENSVTEVHTFCYGAAMSCGFIVFLAGHQRFTGRHATFMIHEPLHGHFDRHHFVINEVKEAKRVKDMVFAYICNNTKITPQTLKEKCGNGNDWYINAKHAVQLGIADAIFDNRPKKAKKKR